MTSARSTGRIVGILILLQMAGGIAVNFILEKPLFGSPGFLLAAASHARQLGCAVVASLLVEAIYAAIAILVFQLARQRTPLLALWLVVLAGVVLALAVLENAAVLSMVSLSEAYANASASGRLQLEALRGVVAAARNWPHFMARMFDGLEILAFYAVLYRSLLISRVLAGGGLVAAALQIVGVALPFFGHDIIFPMLLPLGLSQLALAAWLLAKGFQVQEHGRAYAVWEEGQGSALDPLGAAPPDPPY